MVLGKSFAYPFKVLFLLKVLSVPYVGMKIWSNVAAVCLFYAYVCIYAWLKSIYYNSYGKIETYG